MKIKLFLATVSVTGGWLLASISGLAQAPQPARGAGRPAAVPSMHSPAGAPSNGAIRNVPRIAPPALPTLRTAPARPAPVPGARPHPLEEGTWTSAGFIPSHRGYRDSEPKHRRRVGYADGVYGYGGYPFYGYATTYAGGDLNYDPNDPNNPAAPAASSVAEGGAGEPPPYNGPAYPPASDYGPSSAARRPYNPSGESTIAPSSTAQVSDGVGHPTVTLIFKDGRAPMEIQNYAATQTKIFVRDNGKARDIAISDLDVAATQAANDQNGVEFALPAGH